MLNREVEILAVGLLPLGVQVLDRGSLIRCSPNAERWRQCGLGDIIQNAGLDAIPQPGRNWNARLVEVAEPETQLLDDLAVIGVSVEYAEAAADHRIVGAEDAPGESESRRKIQLIPLP